MAEYKTKINGLIGYRTDYLLKEIDILWSELNISTSFNLPIDSLDTVFLKGINLKNGFKSAIEQIKFQKNEYLSIRYKLNGKQHTIKSFGKIENIEEDKILKILKLITLMKLLKQLNSLSYLASGVRLMDERLEQL